MSLIGLVLCVILIAIGAGGVALIIGLIAKGDEWLWDWILKDDEDDYDD